MRSLRIAHRAERARYETNSEVAMASVYRRATDERDIPPLDIALQAVSLSPYHAGVAGLPSTRLRLPPAFPTCYFPLALLGPGGSGHLEVRCSELRPPEVAIHSMRTMAHSFLVTRLSSTWLTDGPPVVAPVLDIVVTVATDN